MNRDVYKQQQKKGWVEQDYILPIKRVYNLLKIEERQDPLKMAGDRPSEDILSLLPLCRDLGAFPHSFCA